MKSVSSVKMSNRLLSETYKVSSGSGTSLIPVQISLGRLASKPVYRSNRVPLKRYTPAKDEWYDLSCAMEEEKQSEGEFISTLSGDAWRSYMYRSQERFEDRRQWCQWVEFMETLYRAPKVDWVVATMGDVSTQPMTAEERLQWDMEDEPWKYGASSPAEEDCNERIEEQLQWDAVEAYLQTYED